MTPPGKRRGEPSGDSRSAQYWIDHLQLTPHPEGGYYRQTYKSATIIEQRSLPHSFHGDRAASTAIYFLLRGGEFSAFHRIASDEMWHFYAGGPLVVHVLEENGEHWQFTLGANPERGELFQAVAPAGRWFASCLEDEEGFALVGCTVSPGFDFADFEMAERSALTATFPQHAELIEQLTRLSLA